MIDRLIDLYNEYVAKYDDFPIVTYNLTEDQQDKLQAIINEKMLKSQNLISNYVTGDLSEQQTKELIALQQMGRRRRGEYDDGVPRVKVPSPAP